MSDICSVCGLPEDLCMCKTIAKEKAKITVHVTKRRYGKYVTLVEGVSSVEEAKDLSKSLKQTLACGGTIRGKVIELQGDQRPKMRDALLKFGYSEDSIDVS